MNEKTKIILALTQVENIAKLTEGNQWEEFIFSHLSPLQIELKRQLSCIDGRKKTD
jgi:hypothetical protein